MIYILKHMHLTNCLEFEIWSIDDELYIKTFKYDIYSKLIDVRLLIWPRQIYILKEIEKCVPGDRLDPLSLTDPENNQYNTFG